MHPSPFTLDNVVHDPYPQTECDLDTASVWTLHLRVNNTTSAVEHAIGTLLRSGAEALTGYYCGGDSFAEWAEPFDGQEWYTEFGRAVHIYFTAVSLPHAIRTGAELARSAGITEAVNACISTAGDWAQQAEIFERASA